MKRTLVTIVLLCVVLVSSVSCAPAMDCSNLQANESCKRILFIGNSYTYVNDLPNTFAELARSGGHKVEVGISAQGGWTLANHASSSDTLDKIKSTQWNLVVLQEQSEIPAVAQWRIQQMYPAARTLISDIRAAGAKPMLFITWAHRDGLPDNGMPNFSSMQSQIDLGYLNIAAEQNVPVAPVGYAWAAVQNQYPQIKLWQEDGSHPTMEGTYLAACVFYADIFQQSPEGLSYQAGLTNETAQALQKTAAQTVFNGQWGIP